MPIRKLNRENLVVVKVPYESDCGTVPYTLEWEHVTPAGQRLYLHNTANIDALLDCILSKLCIGAVVHRESCAYLEKQAAKYTRFSRSDWMGPHSFHSFLHSWLHVSGTRGLRIVQGLRVLSTCQSSGRIQASVS